MILPLSGTQKYSQPLPANNAHILFRSIEPSCSTLLITKSVCLCFAYCLIRHFNMLFYTLHHMSFVYFQEGFCQVWKLLKKVRSSFTEWDVLDQNRRGTPFCSKQSRKEMFTEQRDSSTKGKKINLGKWISSCPFSALAAKWTCIWALSKWKVGHC